MIGPESMAQATRSETSSGVMICVCVFVLSTLMALAGAEGVLRLKNSSMNNYDIEMWRYAKELKAPSENPLLGHEHKRSASAMLQSVRIRLNDWGLRGGPVALPAQGKRRLLFLGGSITLGWGVKEEDTITSQIERLFADHGQQVEVLNAGVANYNALRYVEHFLRDLTPLQPTDIVVHYFLRDAEVLERGGGNVLLRHSQLAITMWTLANRVLRKTGDMTIVDHYKAIYHPASPGFATMVQALERLSGYAKENKIRLYLAMTPDVHNLKNYQLGQVHKTMRGVAKRLGYTYVDFLPVLSGLPPESIWAMPGDPHPNALGHRRMAEALYPILAAAR